MATYKLDTQKRADEVLKFEADLKKKVIGQDSAVDEVVRFWQSYVAGMKMIGRPISNILMLGPTGVGKTLLVEAIAEMLFGNRNALLKVNCSEMKQSHDVSKLVGAPHGYVGYGDKPAFHQSNVDKYHTNELKISLVLFDEIEKADSTLWKILLSILDKGTVGLGNGDTTDFTSSFIFMTSNLGSKEINSIHSGYGFTPTVDCKDLDSRIDNISRQASLKHFSPEFMNRLDSIIVFNSLTQDNMRKILDVETGMVQGRIMLSKTPYVVTYSDAAKDQLLKEGYDKKYGARHLKRNLEKNIVFPLTSFMASKQVGTGDVVSVDYKDGEFVFEVSIAKAMAAVCKVMNALRQDEELSKIPDKDKDKKKDKSWPFSNYI